MAQASGSQYFDIIVDRSGTDDCVAAKDSVLTFNGTNYIER